MKLDRLTRLVMCSSGKIGFYTLAQANENAQAGLRKGLRLWAYKCPECRRFHHTRNNVSRKNRMTPVPDLVLAEGAD